MNKLRKVICGGQTGVDQAALRAAKDCGLEIGGWCPPGRQSEDGVILAEFPLKETPHDRSPDAPELPRSQRTEWNVRDSDGTLVIVSREASHPPSRGFGVASSEAATEDISPGTKWTMECVRRYGRPFLVCSVADPSAKDRILKWLDTFVVKALNVAGPSQSESPGIGERVYALLRDVFAMRQRTPAK
ncbi:MAG: hypothetical protein V7609_417 [Verrucomicrobiota bacterium]